ncbi:MAG: MarR family transcriptional regulator [Burkholderiaceae bacterium]|jgi:DNA-binding MarR family transcriptional regulator|nr:MarR family transcriptional regulator [Burkholderiaceae bacterium]
MFEQCLYFNTTSLARKLEREWTVAFKPFGLTPPQAFMLRVILQKPASLQSELAKEMNISRSTATRTLDGLQKLDYIKRSSSDKDGRESEIHPTTKALKIRDEVNQASTDVTKRLKKLLGNEIFERTVGDVRAVCEAV